LFFFELFNETLVNVLFVFIYRLTVSLDGHGVSIFFIFFQSI